MSPVALCLGRPPLHETSLDAETSTADGGETKQAHLNVGGTVSDAVVLAVPARRRPRSVRPKGSRDPLSDGGYRSLMPPMSSSEDRPTPDCPDARRLDNRIPTSSSLQ